MRGVCVCGGGGGGGGYSWCFWVGVCHPILKTLTLFQTWLLKCIPYFRPCDVYQILQLSIDLRHTWHLKQCSCFLSLRSTSTEATCYSKNGIPDQIDGVYTLFQTKIAKSIPYFRLEMLENDTLWDGTYLYGLYMGVHPPGHILTSSESTLFLWFVTWYSRCMWLAAFFMW